MNIYHVLDYLKEKKVNATAIIDGNPTNFPAIVFSRSSKSGMGHWIVVEETATRFYIFDPYGTPPGVFFKVNNWTLRKPKPPIWSNLTGQRFGTAYCGLFCVAFLLLRQTKNWPKAADYIFPETGPTRDNWAKLKSILGESPDAILARYGFKCSCYQPFT